MPMFEIREGDGNQGCYRRDTIEASDAYEALRIASRRKLIHKPKDAKLANIEGDDEYAVLCSYVAPIYGYASRWVAEANLITATLSKDNGEANGNEVLIVNGQACVRGGRDDS